MSRLKMLFRDRRGFTLIEIMMVLLLVAILAGLGITQFANFSAEAKNNTVRSNLKILRQAIATQNAQMRLRCAVNSAAWPTLLNITGNDITSGAGALCTAGQVANASDRVFVSGGIPVNSWGGTAGGAVNTVVQCVGGCANRALSCVGGAARTSTADGWCYDVATGQIWPDSANNDGAGAGTGNEYSY